jgi:hypothetical protein
LAFAVLRLNERSPRHHKKSNPEAKCRLDSNWINRARINKDFAFGDSRQALLVLRGIRHVLTWRNLAERAAKTFSKLYTRVLLNFPAGLVPFHSNVNSHSPLRRSGPCLPLRPFASLISYYFLSRSS